MVTPEKREKDEAKRAKQAEAARLRYHRLSAEEKRELNVKRTLAQKRKRQREKEMEELEELLRQTNDIQEVRFHLAFIVIPKTFFVRKHFYKGRYLLCRHFHLSVNCNI